MPIVTIRHRTTYRYRNPVAFGEHRMMLRPRESYDQRLISADLNIGPGLASLRNVQDLFGNCVGIARFAGRSDILHRVYSRDGKGSYGGILSKGLTSLPESWDAMMDGVRSLNHCMLGHVMEWFYGYVGGIRQAPGSVGWKNILIAPNPGPLASSEATLQTPNGRVVSRWSKDGETFRLETEIPEGVSATAILPSGEMKELRGGKQTLKEPVQMPK